MPIIKSAKKRVRVARKAAARNRKTKRSLKTALKAFQSKLTAASQRQAQSELDKAVKKGIIHKNKAARKQRQLAAAAKAASVKTTAKKTAKKPAAKKASTKTAAKTRKPATRKTAKSK